MTALGVERGLHAFQILQGVFFGGNDEFRHFALAFICHIRTANFVHNEANRPCERGFLAQIGPRNNRTGSNARARHNGSARAKRRSKLRMRAALKHVNAVVECTRIALARRATHFARRHFFAHEFELATQNINAHAAQRVVGNLALAHQIHTIAVCLHGNARRYRRFGGFFLKQLVDNILQNVDFHLRARRGAFAFFSGSQQRHHEIRNEQREHNNARRKEDEQVAVGKRRRRGNEIRKRHNDRKRHGALRASKRNHGRVTQEIGVDSRTGALAIARELLHNHDPRETHAKHDGRDEHDKDEEPRAALTARRIPCRQNNLGKLHAQQHEHDAINHEYDELPHVFAGHSVARRLDGKRARVELHEQRSRDHGQNAAHGEVFGGEVREKRHDHFEQQKHRGRFKTERAHAAKHEHHDCREHKAHDHAANEVEQKGGRCVEQRERSRDGRRNGEFERHNARCVVEQSLARKQRLLAIGELDVFAHGGNGGGVGGAERGAQSESSRKRNGRHNEVQHEANHERRNEHQTNSERDDVSLVFPKGALIGMARLVEKQRRDKDEQEELRIGNNRRGVFGDEEADHRAKGDLHKRHGQAGKYLVENA